MPLIHLGCPSCGGTLSLEEGARLTTCLHCRGASLAIVPGAVPRYAVRCLADAAEARAAAQAALRRPGVPRPLRTAARFENPTLCYVPFYEATGVRLGRLFLKERVKPPLPLEEGPGADANLQRWLEDPGVESAETRIVEQDVTSVGAACRLAELGVERIDLAGLRRGGGRLELLPFDPVALRSGAVVFSPTIPVEQFRDQAGWRLPAQGDKTRIAGQRVKLLFYPIWQLRYQYLGRAHEIAVNGVTGAILCGTAPRDLTVAAALAAGGTAALAFSLGRILRGLLPRPAWLGRLWAADLPGLGAGGLLLLAIAGAAAAWVGWRLLAEGGEIRLADGAHP